MSPAEIIKQSALDGVAITLSHTTTIKLKGDQLSVDKWLPIIREKKFDIIFLLQQKEVKKDNVKTNLVTLKSRNMSYENFLVACREGDNNPSFERISHLKGIAKEIDATSHLNEWIGKHTSGITLIMNSADAVAEINLLKLVDEIIGIDIETAKAVGYNDHSHAGLHQKLSSIRLVQLFQGNNGKVIIIDCFAAGYEWISALAGGRFVAHNSLFESNHFWYHLKEELDIECTMLAERVFEGKNKKLSELAEDYLDLEMSKSLQVSDWSRPILLDEQIAYAAADAVAAKLLWQKYKAMFEDDYTYWVTYQFLKTLIYPVIRQAGIGFDIQRHKEIVSAWQIELETTRQKLAELGLSNPGSVKQKQTWLEQHLSGVDKIDWPTTETGNLSTSASVLEQALHIPGAAPLARWSQLSTRINNFGLGLAEKVIDGMLYPNYRIAGTETGRFGCQNPNIQNQPRTGFKHLYIAPSGFNFVTGDLSQIELRVAGLISNDSVINEAYAQGRDLHREVAAERAGKEPKDITKEERQAAKAINFGLIFGAGAATLQAQALNSYGVVMTIEEAEEAKKFFHQKYQRFSDWQREVVADANSYRYSESPYTKLTRHYRDRVYTHAMNYPIQSGAWEILALAIVYIDARLPKDGSIKISHHVYDELCLISQNDKTLEAALLLRDGFLHGFKTVFPEGATRGLVEIGAGSTWEDAGKAENLISEASL